MSDLGPFRDYETARLFDWRDGKIFDRSGGYEVWPDASDCVCVPETAEYDPDGGQLFVQFTPDKSCPVHTQREG
jgi:hypothetical protein